MFNNYVATISLPPLNIISCSIKTHIFFILNVYSCIHSTWPDLVIYGLYIEWPNPSIRKLILNVFLKQRLVSI